MSYEHVKVRFYKKKWFKILAILILLIAVVSGVVAWKAGLSLSRISTRGGIFKSILHNIPGVEDTLKGEKEGRINILLLGMRGEDVPGGGLLADTIMVVSVLPQENKISLISVPRDLWVNNSGWGNKTKINAIYAAGEENGKKQGISDMEKVIGEISGMPIHYAVSINFEGFKDIIDAIGGVDIHLDSEFTESLQFRGGAHRCDDVTFVVPSGTYETKKVTRKNGTYYFKQYPMCFSNTPSECGGVFKLSAGDVTLNGEQALCFVRSRETSSDFERAKRQQIILQLIKEKALKMGTLTDFGKVNGMFSALGNNVRTDMELWEMQKFFATYQKMSNFQLYQRVLENTEEGLLYHPADTPETGYILLPRGDNYDKIHELFSNIFNLPPQSDIKPK